MFMVIGALAMSISVYVWTLNILSIKKKVSEEYCRVCMQSRESWPMSIVWSRWRARSHLRQIVATCINLNKHFILYESTFIVPTQTRRLWCDDSVIDVML